MNYREIGLGITLIIVFFAFQIHYFSPLGIAEWFVGALIFVTVHWILWKKIIPKPSDTIKELWKFCFLFVLLFTAAISFIPSNVIGVIISPNYTILKLTPFILGLWLIVFGGLSFVTGWMEKSAFATFIGIMWLFLSPNLVFLTGSNSYIYFGFIVGFSFIVSGLIRKI